jgi:hypothetical protein
VAFIAGTMAALEVGADTMQSAIPAIVEDSSGGRLKLEGAALKAFRDYAKAYQESLVRKPPKPDAGNPVSEPTPVFPPMLPTFTGRVYSGGDAMEAALSSFGSAIEQLAVISQQKKTAQKRATIQVAESAARQLEESQRTAKAIADAAIKKASQAKRNKAALALILMELA